LNAARSSSGISGNDAIGMTLRTTQTERLREAATLLIATLMASSVALYDRYPLVFSDTGDYLFFRHYETRSIFYSSFLALTRPTHTLWTVVFAQSLLVVWMLRVVLRAVFAIGSRLEFLALTAIISVVTSLPWFTGFAMPDIFTPVMVLGLFILAFCPDRLSRLERCLIVALTFLAMVVHYSHLPIALGLLASGFIFRAVFGRSLRLRAPEALPHLMLPALLIAADVVAVVTSNYITLGIPSYSPGGYAFVLARLVGDGPAVEYLREHCPTRHYAACAYLDRMPMSSDAFLWGPGSLFGNGGFLREREEGSEIIRGTIEEYPRWVARDAIADTIRQIFLFQVGYGLRDAAHDPATQWLLVRFPNEFDSYIKSRQSRGEFAHYRSLWGLQKDFVVVSVFYCLFVALLLVRDRQWLVLDLMITVGLAIIFNGFVSGALSEPVGRYGARLIWLVPLIALASWRKALGLPRPEAGA
jgi:hypothetical protein